MEACACDHRPHMVKPASTKFILNIANYVKLHSRQKTPQNNNTIETINKYQHVKQNVEADFKFLIC